MAFVSFPITTNNLTCRNTMQTSHIHPASTFHNNSRKLKANNASVNTHLALSCQSLMNQRRHRELLVPICCAKDSPELGEGGDQDQQDPQVLETMLKLYNAMKNKNVVEFSEIIADEPDSVGNLPSIIQPLLVNKKVVDFFFNLMRRLGSEIEFIVKPTLHDGLKVGLQWGIEWDKSHRPFGKGFSFHISHHYKGKLIIKNFEMLVEPLLHFPYRMKLKEIMTLLTEKMGSNAMLKDRRSKVVSSIFLLLVAAAFLISLLTSH